MGSKEALTKRDFEIAVELVEHFHDDGHEEAARAVYRLIVQAERSGARPPVTIDEDLTEDDLEALDRSEADIAAGRIIPDEIVHQGRAAVAEYKRARAAGEITLEPEVQEAVDAFRREREARLISHPDQSVQPRVA